jgi:hypothetical protein
VAAVELLLLLLLLAADPVAADPFTGDPLAAAPLTTAPPALPSPLLLLLLAELPLLLANAPEAPFAATAALLRGSFSSIHSGIVTAGRFHWS